MSEDRARKRTSRGGREQRKNTAGGMQLLMVQSISCVIILLIALLMRLIGGSTFEQLRQSFDRAMMDNRVIDTLITLLDPASSANSSSSAAEGTSTPSNAVSVSDPAVSDAESKLSATETIAYYAPPGSSFARLNTNFSAALPVTNGTVTSLFGYRENSTGSGESFHQGLDIAAAAGSPIFAMYYGKVVEVGQSASYGNYVKLDHGNGIQVLYAHCAEVLVEEGVYVRAGETVARVGNTGDSTGPHLHTEIRANGLCYDPAWIVPLQKYA